MSAVNNKIQKAVVENNLFALKSFTKIFFNGFADNERFGKINQSSGSAGRGDLDVQAPWRNRHEVGDRRRFIVGGSGGRTLTKKHIDRFGNVQVMRLAEMYLTRAEANFRLETSIGDTPLNDINRIRNRAGLANLGAVTLDAILKERDLELAYEGHFMHDRKRNRQDLPGSNPATNALPWNSDKLIFPIPQRETDVNENLIQNSGYN